MSIDYEKAARDYEDMFGGEMYANVKDIVDEYDGDIEKAYEDDRLSLGEYDCLRDAQRD